MGDTANPQRVGVALIGWQFITSIHAEADRMIEACQRAKVKVIHAEELCFAPKYRRLKALLDEGALGRPILIEQSDKA